MTAYDRSVFLARIRPRLTSCCLAEVVAAAIHTALMEALLLTQAAPPLPVYLRRTVVRRQDPHLLVRHDLGLRLTPRVRLRHHQTPHRPLELHRILLRSRGLRLLQ